MALQPALYKKWHIVRSVSAAPRLLLVFAHPDDETFVAGGICRRYADSGAEIALVTATRGDAGRRGEPPLCSREELPARREAELRDAAGILGLHELHLLDYRDKYLDQAPVTEVRATLVDHIRRFRPHVLLTFDPQGMNGHPDHVAISRFAMDAVEAAADEPHGNEAMAYRVPRVLWNGPLAPWKVTEAPDLRRLNGVHYLVDTVASRQAKAEALRAHRTQQVPIERCFFEKPDVEAILSVEIFRDASGPDRSPAPRSEPASDLFEGLDLRA